MRKHLLIVLIILLTTSKMFAQNLTVTGKVTDASTNEPMIGVTVEVRGTRAGTATNMDGTYTLQVPSNATLSFIFLGYQTKEVPVAGKSVINVTLSENASQLNEVVVVGYGTMRKKDLTGAVTQIIPDRIAAENPKTVQDILRGTVGVNITNNPSAKGGGDITVRGQRSVYTDGGHNNPLIVLDGMIFTGDMTEINPDDIGQIDILKDASSAAIYGAQAANGVFIITTKRGQQGKPVVNISMNLGATQKSDYRHVWDAQGFLQHREDYYKAPTYGMNTTTGVYEAYRTGTTPVGYFDNPDNLSQWGIDLDTWRNNGNIKPAAGESDLSLWARRLGLSGEGTQLQLDNYLKGKTFDWYNHTFRTGINRDVNASVSGASDRMNFYLSLGYSKTQGAVTKDDFENFRANMKVSGNVTKWLEISANVNFQKRVDPDGDYIPNLNPANSAINSNQIRNSPFSNYKNDDGTLTWQPNGIGNFKGVNQDFVNQFQEMDKGTYSLTPLFNAKVTLPLGITYSFNAQPRLSWYHNYKWQSSQNPAWVSTNGFVYRENRWWFTWLLNNQLLWEKTFAKVHRVSLTLGQEAGRDNSWRDYLNARNFQPSDALKYHNTINSTKDNSDYSTEDTQQSSASYFGRLFYSYNDRYMLTTTVRRDGYSAFGTSNPWAVFPSVALAWTFTNEKFFNYFEALNYGKLRVSWGQNGNRALNDPYIALANLSGGGTNRYGYINSSGQLVDFQYLQISRMANPNLKWETSEAWNYGLDFGLFNNRLAGSLEYYTTTTKNMIMNQTLVAFAGFSNMTTNLGEVSNKGVEVSLNSTNIKTHNFEWNTIVSFSYNDNKIVHLYGTYDDVLDADGNVIGKKEQNDRGNGWFIGQPIDEIWDFKQTGIWQASDYDKAKTDYNQRPGDPIVWKNPANPLQKDNATGFYRYDDNDKLYLGRRTPPVLWSMRNDFTLFKNLTVSFYMYAKMGHKFLSSDYMNNDNESNALVQGANHFVKQYWTPENPSTEYARIQAVGPTGANTPGKLFDRSFIRFQTLSLSYSVPKRWISKLDMNNLKVFGSIQNLGYWAKDWPYGDPETMGGQNSGDYNSNTNNTNGLQGLATRTFSIGINATF